MPTVSHSNDGGATWTTKTVDATQLFPNVDTFTDLAIGADGTVYVSWLRCTAGASSGECANTTGTFYYAKSTDGGNTWSAPAKIASARLAPDPGFCCFYGALPNTNERVSNIPALNGFKKTHAYVNNRSQDTFYNADRTLLVSITGEPGKPDENTDTHGLVYARFQPAISEKTILGMNQQKVVCQ